MVTKNPVKSCNVVFSLKCNKQVRPPLFLNSNIVKDAESHIHLGLTLQSSMSWRNHIVQVYEKATKRFKSMLKFVTCKLDCSILTSLCKNLIRPLMEYGGVIWNNCYDCHSALHVLDSVQFEAAKLVTGTIKGTSSARLYKELAWESLSSAQKEITPSKSILQNCKEFCAHLIINICTCKVTVYLQIDNFLQIWIFGSKYWLKCNL